MERSGQGGQRCKPIRLSLRALGFLEFSGAAVANSQTSAREELTSFDSPDYACGLEKLAAGEDVDSKGTVPIQTNRSDFSEGLPVEVDDGADRKTLELNSAGFVPRLKSERLLLVGPNDYLQFLSHGELGLNRSNAVGAGRESKGLNWGEAAGGVVDNDFQKAFGTHDV